MTSVSVIRIPTKTWSQDLTSEALESSVELDISVAAHGAGSSGEEADAESKVVGRDVEAKEAKSGKGDLERGVASQWTESGGEEAGPELDVHGRVSN